MKTVTAKLYEGMFLVDSALAASDWQGIIDSISSILKRVDAEIVSIRKWDDRKLAYDIMGKSRGVYILAYFRVDGKRMPEIERAVQLSEKIMRLLVLSVEDVDEEYLDKESPAAKGQEEISEVEQELEDEEEPEKEYVFDEEADEPTGVKPDIKPEEEGTEKQQ